MTPAGNDDPLPDAAPLPAVDLGAGAVVDERHGVRRVDEFAWMRPAEGEEPSERTLLHLRAEREYYDARTSHTRPLQQAIVDEMSRRTSPADRSVSWTRGGLVYYTQTVPGKEYEQFFRAATQDSPVELLLDENVLAERAPGGAGYLRLGLREPSPDGRLLAYSVDVEGDEVYALRFRDLATGTDLADVVPRSYYGGAWSADSSTFFYVVHDESYRPYQVRRHRIGTDAALDPVVLQEDDQRFEVILEASRSGAFVVLHSETKDSSESWLVPADRPDEPPRSVAPRRPGVIYRVSHAPGPDSDVLVIVTDDGAPEGRLVTAPVDAAGPQEWAELVPEDPAERLLAADAFARHVVLTLRRDGSPLLRVLRRDRSAPPVDVHPGVLAGSVRLGVNEEYDVDAVTVVVESYTEPAAWYRVDLDSGERELLKRQDVPGYDRGGYESDRLFVEAPDGERVPVTVARRRDTPLDGSAPCLLYGYGAYEAVDEPAFDVALPSLLDRGVVFAHAHVRGGGELGRRWWREGSLERKQNTFADFVAVADGIADRLVDGDAIVARGLSAGGLLMGAVFSQAPSRWRGVVAEVPFVDVVTTMLDETIPLTAQEWDEWGDPRRPADFAWMLAYSPYDNVPDAKERPRLLVTAALHDPRVMYWEPAKWVARLRATGSSDDRLLFRIELGAGAHAGPSGRYARLAYEAEVYAWVLDTLARSDSR